MINIIYTILLFNILIIVFKMFEKYKVDNLQGLIINYLTAAICSYFFLEQDFSINNILKSDGLFSEYTFKSGEFFNVTAGIRADYYNNTKKFNYIPRLNMKYNPNEKTAFRLSVGRAFRIANVFVENASFLASGRSIYLGNIDPEIAWNYGAKLTYCFYLN